MTNLQIMFPVIEFDGYGGMKDTVFQMRSEDLNLCVPDTFSVNNPSDLDSLVVWWTAQDGYLVYPGQDLSFWDWVLSNPVPPVAWVVFGMTAVYLAYQYFNNKKL